VQERTDCSDEELAEIVVQKSNTIKRRTNGTGFVL